ncbi:MAG TPA: hypothetical protein VLA85_01150 [Verrucomicrobiae bacterium]|jgi:hypothetical protein|nr:hypothetical protein [Verrucomicrobiae bacterium]
MKKLIAAMLFSIALLTGGTINASANDWGKFTIHNQSNYIIVGFYTNEGDGWSSNWLQEQVTAGDSALMEFTHQGPCQVTFRVGWLTTTNEEQLGEPWNIDICDAHNVYFDDDKASYD